jgi:hypothetical protein
MEMTVIQKFKMADMAAILIEEQSYLSIGAALQPNIMYQRHFLAIMK